MSTGRLIQSHSGPIPEGGTDIDPEAQHGASFNHVPRFENRPQERSSRHRRFPHDLGERKYEELRQSWEILRRELEHCRSEKKLAEDQLQSRTIRLFHNVKEAKKYDEVEALYDELVIAKDLEMSVDPEILDIRYSFAESLCEQGNFKAAEPISRAVWELRHDISGLSEESKQSHRQICSILSSLPEFGEAERMHRFMYHRQPLDAWALENGDEICLRLAAQKRFFDAKNLQNEVCIQRREQFGHRDVLTIRSRGREINFLENLIDGNEAHRKFSGKHHKKSFECEYDAVLREQWDARSPSESNDEILNAGHKLGNRCFQGKEFSAAKEILELVCEDKKSKYGDNDVSTLSSRSILGKVLHRQGTSETIQQAIRIFEAIWCARQSDPGSKDIDTISSGEDLAQAYYSLSEFSNAETIYRWIVERKKHIHSWTADETMSARWNLGQVLCKQGAVKSLDLEEVLGDLYEDWKKRNPRSPITLQCGQMLAESLCNQEEKTDKALEIAREIFNQKETLGQQALLYLDNGRLLGLLLLKRNDHLEAEIVLRPLWNHEAKAPEEEKMHLMIGNKLSQCLLDQQKFTEAKQILDSITENQAVVFPPGDPQIVETEDLLQKTQNSLKRKSTSTTRPSRSSYWKTKNARVQM